MNTTTALLDLAALRQLEARADAAGLQLMQRAAAAIADWVRQRYPTGSRVLAAVGPGNNGGDALYAAALLHGAGYRVEVLLPQAPGSPATQAALQHWQALGGSVRPTLPPQPPELLLDGLFGVGLSRPLQGAWPALLQALDALPCHKLAIDVPSGLDAYTGQPQPLALHADTTLALLCAKPGLYTAAGPDHCGQVLIDDLACPAALWPPHAGSLALPAAEPLRRPRDSHKGRYGSVAIVGGAPGMLGAAVLAGRGALALGAGKVFVLTLAAAPGYDPQCPELMLRDWQHGMALPDSQLLVAGPGLGLSDAAHQALERLLPHRNRLLLDADALNLLAVDDALQQLLRARSHDTVLTPHPTEAARLLECDTADIQADRVAAVQTLAARYGCTVLLKGCGSLVAACGQPYRLLQRGSPALAVAGQGDVLAGAIAALLAQGMDSLEATLLAADVHAVAGEQYAQQAGGCIGLTAASVLPLMSRELNRRIGA